MRVRLSGEKEVSADLRGPGGEPNPNEPSTLDTTLDVVYPCPISIWYKDTLKYVGESWSSYHV